MNIFHKIKCRYLRWRLRRAIAKCHGRIDPEACRMRHKRRDACNKAEGQS